LQRRNEDEVLLHPLNMIFFEKNSMDTEENNNRKCSLVSASLKKERKKYYRCTFTHLYISCTKTQPQSSGFFSLPEYERVVTFPRTCAWSTKLIRRLYLA